MLTILLGAGLTVLLAFVSAGLVVGAPWLGWLPRWAQVAVVVLAAAAVAVVAAFPGPLGRVLGKVRWGSRRLVGGERPLTSLVPAIGWSAAAWVCYGLHLWVLVVPLGLGGADGLRLAVGGFALAWVCGFLAVVVPAGVGVREAVLVGVLGASIGSGEALAVAVLSRFLIIVAEAGLLALTPVLAAAGRAGDRATAARAVHPARNDLDDTRP